MTSKHPSRLQRLGSLLTLVLFSTAALAADPQAVRYYEDAVSRFNSGDLKGAEIQLKNSLTRDPSQLPARILMGRVQLGLGNAQQAEEDLQLANKLGADRVLTILPLAKARNNNAKYKENIENLVPTEFPIDQQPDIWVELGIARLLDSDVAGGKIAFEQALKIQPLHEGGTLGLAQIPLREGDFLEAENLATAATSLFPNSAQAFFLKASALHAQGKNIKAAAAYARAMDIDPQNSLAGSGEAAALLDDNQTEKAAALLQELRTKFPMMPEASYLHSEALKKLGRYEEAESALNAATDILSPISPSDLAHKPELLKLAGTIAYENNQLERAYQAISLYTQARQGDIDGMKLLARIALGMDKPAEVKRALVPLVTAGTADAEILGLLGDASARQKDYITAESYYRDALANYSGGPAIVGRLGAMQYRKGQREAALNTLRGLVDERPPGTPTGVSLYMAMVLFAEGQMDEAQAIADRLVEEQPENLVALNLQATLAITRGDRQDARQMLNALIEKDPTFRPARYNLAKLLIIEKDFREAEVILARFLAEDPNDIRALHELARLAVAVNDRRTALQHYEEIRQIDSKALIPAIELIDLYLAESRLADAMNTAVGLTRLLPNSFFAHEALARVLLARNELDDARAALKKLALMAGYDTRELMQAAKLQQSAKAYADAEWTLSKVLNERPNDIYATRELAVALYRQGKLKEAEELVERTLTMSPKDAYALALLGDIQLALGRPQVAADIYTRALQSADTAELVVGRYVAMTLAGDPKAALTDLQAWHDAHPDEPLVLRALAERRHQLGDTGEARRLYEQLLRLRPDDALLYNNMANLLMNVDNEHALQAAKRAHELAPANPSILDTLGWILVQLGDLDQGLAYLREAVARNGRSAAARYHLGVALWEFGSHAESKRELSHALRIASDESWIDDAKRRLQQLN